MSNENESTGRELQLVTFCLGSENYAVEVSRVKEIILPMDTYPVPGMPGQVRGVINLRGEIVPVLEIHSILGVSRKGEDDAERKDRIIILDTEEGGLGFDVDGVTEVIRVSSERIKASRDIGNVSFNRDVMLGIVQTKTGIIICIDPVKLVDSCMDMEELAGCRV